MRDAFDRCGQTGWRIYLIPSFKGTLAAAHVGLGQTGDALDAVNDAIANSGPQHGQMWYLSELLRIKGEVLLQQASDQAAEKSFTRAGEMARAQDALFWELRVALSLARLRMTQGRRDEAQRLLAPVYDQFIEGFDTIDLREAKTILS